MSKYVEDEPVDLVGGVEEFVKNNIAEPPKRHKKHLHTQHFQSKTSNVVIVQALLFE